MNFASQKIQIASVNLVQTLADSKATGDDLKTAFLGLIFTSQLGTDISADEAQTLWNRLKLEETLMGTKAPDGVSTAPGGVTQQAGAAMSS